MPDSLRAILPDFETLFDLPPEELAGIILNWLALPDQGHLHALTSLYVEVQRWDDLPRNRWNEAYLAVTEAWSWLIHNGLLVPSPSQSNTSGYMELTRRGLEVAAAGTFDNYRKAAAFPRSLLHPTISAKAWANFIRGDYDTAVFQAFKEVEVTVRTAGGFDDGQLAYSS